MNHDLQNHTDAADPLASPYPEPAQFDANMIAAAQPVEPLATVPNRRSQTLRQFLKGRLGLLAVLLIGGLLSAAIAGMLLGFRGAAEPAAVETQAAPPVLNQTAEEIIKTSAPTHQPAKTSENPSRKAVLQLSQAPARVDAGSPQATDARADEKSVARKVGELVYKWEKEDRKDRRKAERHRPKDNNDDH
jgi:hypothetical protein